MLDERYLPGAAPVQDRAPIDDHPDPSNPGFIQIQLPSIEITEEQQMVDGYEPGMRYNLNASMSPEGRREYGV